MPVRFRLRELQNCMSSKIGVVDSLLSSDIREARFVCNVTMSVFKVVTSVAVGSLLSTNAFVATSMLAMGISTFRISLDPISLSKPGV